MTKLNVAIYGNNGHQIQGRFPDHPRAEMVAAAACDPESIGEAVRGDVRFGGSLDDLLDDPGIQLISLCSPRRLDQVTDAIRCLEAGKHVLAEKPCAFTEDQLDTILQTADRTGCCFREMAGTVYEQPYWSMRHIVAAGTIGEVVQVVAQKSYPMHERRPQDENVDGGLIRQNGVHAFRFIEHVSGIRMADVTARETQLGNPWTGGLRVASGFLCTLENGGVATAIANYLNPDGFGSWGNEAVRVFGTDGFVEALNAGAHTRMVVGTHDYGPIELQANPDHFDALVDMILDGAPMPLSADDEIHPTRMIIRAKAAAEQCAGQS